MELTTEDKQRIADKANELYKAWDIDNSTIVQRLRDMGEYATIYEREQQAEQAQDQIDSDHVQIKQLEAERTELRTIEDVARAFDAGKLACERELRNKVIDECVESLKAKGVEESDYNGKIILSTLNSLKTK